MALRLEGISNETYGNMQVVASPSINFTGALTPEAWIKPKREVETSGYFVFKADLGGGGGWGSYMLGQWRGGRLDARIATTDGGLVRLSWPVPPVAGPGAAVGAIHELPTNQNVDEAKANEMGNAALLVLTT